MSTELSLASGKLTVNVCGRTIGIMEPCSTLSELQLFLQDELGMQDQVFEVFDVSGTRILLDTDLREAVADQRTPLSATLSDASIHFIENRREELAQMQWKLVRDQHNTASSKMNVIGRKLQEQDNRIEKNKRDLELSVKHLQMEVLAAVEAAKELSRNEFKQLSERLAGVGQLVQVERNMREVAMEQVNKLMQGVHDTIDQDRGLVQQGAGMAMGHIDGARKLISVERASREALEEKHQRELEGMRERVDEMSANFRQTLSEYGRQFQQASVDASEAVEQHRNRTDKVKQAAESHLEAANQRIALLEERSTTLEAHLSEQARRQSEMVERMANRHEKVAGSVEQMRFTHGQAGFNIDTITKRMDEMQAQIGNNEQQLREVYLNERRARDTEMRSLREALGSENERLKTHLEGKISHSIQEESGARSDHVSAVLDSVGSALKQQNATDSTCGSQQAYPVALPRAGYAHSVITSITDITSGSMQLQSGPAMGQQASVQIPIGGRPSASSSYVGAAPGGSVSFAVGPPVSTVQARGQSPTNRPPPQVFAAGPTQAYARSVSQPKNMSPRRSAVQVPQQQRQRMPSAVMVMHR
jgi:hypothetical protein